MCRVVQLFVAQLCISLYNVFNETPCCRSTSRNSATLPYFAVVELFVASVLNLIILICYNLLFDVVGTSILIQMPNIAYSTTWRRVLGDHGCIS